MKKPGFFSMAIDGIKSFISFKSDITHPADKTWESESFNDDKEIDVQYIDSSNKTNRDK